MSQVDHYQLSAILGSTIVGEVPVFHGQLTASTLLRSAEAISNDMLECEADAADSPVIDPEKLFRVFREVRAKRADQSSADLYIADKIRNEQLVEAWRESGLTGPVRELNRCLMNGRTASKLKGLKSVKFEIDRNIKERVQFVCEFVACELRYEKGASIDDILCCPILSTEFDRRCRAVVTDASWLDFRWTILSLRKAGRNNKPSASTAPHGESALPTEFDHVVNLRSKDLPKNIPDTSGVFALVEGSRELYVAGTGHLRTSLAYHSQPGILALAQNAIWRPVGEFSFRYLEVDKNQISQVQNKIIAAHRPLFNVPRTTA